MAHRQRQPIAPPDGLRLSDSGAAMGDDEPIVILDQPEAFLPAPTGLDGRLLADVVAFAQARLAAGAGASALEVVGAHQLDLITAYGLGYLPLNWQESLGADARRAFAGRRLANSLVLPAYSAEGVVVDALSVHARPAGGAYVGWLANPHGLLGAGIASAFSDLIVCDSLRVLGRCFARGIRHALLLRGVADATLNAPRLVAAGVRRIDLRVRRHAAGYADALRAAGLEVQVSSIVLDAGAGHVAVPVAPMLPEPEVDPHAVEEPEPTSAPAAEDVVLVHHDRRSEVATFRAGAITYVVEVPADGRTTLDVTMRHGADVQRDRFDLAVPAARERFAGCAALRGGLPAPTVAGHLAALLSLVHGLAAEEAPSRPAQSMSMPPDAAQVRDWLGAPDLLGRIAADLDALGWVGEESAKRLAYLVSISRKLPSPLWCQRVLAPGAGVSGIDLIADLTPPEDVIRVSRLTAGMLDQQGPDSLRHALLVVDDGSAIAEDAVLALRILHERGALAVARPRSRGGVDSLPPLTEVRGPLALLTATSRRIDEGLASLCLRLPLDDSPSQTARVIASQGRAYSRREGKECEARLEEIRARHHALHRALACRPVVIAGVERIAFPAASVQDRRDHALFLGVVAAHALLHQHQRLSDGEAVLADERDVTAAIALAAAAGIGGARPLSTSAQDLLASCERAALSEVTVRDVADLHPAWTAYQTRGAIAELVAAGHLLAVSGGGQGRRVAYRLAVAGARSGGSRIHLRAATETVATFAKRPEGVTPEGMCG